MDTISISTDRLILRQWTDADLEPFAKLNNDPQVMKYFPSVLERCESDALAMRIQDNIASWGWGFWAVERREDKAFLGFTGLSQPEGLAICPCIEIGWRLAKAHWGKGYATEAAKASLKFAFMQLPQLGSDVESAEVVSFTSVGNMPSRRVMEKVGMTNSDKNFYHPKVPQQSSLREHVLYTIKRSRWVGQQDSL